jgi:hypothetical protein
MKPQNDRYFFSHLQNLKFLWPYNDPVGKISQNLGDYRTNNFCDYIVRGKKEEWDPSD